MTKEKKLRYYNVSSDFLPASSKTKTIHDLGNFNLWNFKFIQFLKRKKGKSLFC